MTEREYQERLRCLTDPMDLASWRSWLAGKRKVYLVYQSGDGDEWEQVYETSYVGTDESFEEAFSYDGLTHPFLVPYSGFYRLTACGAKGEDYLTHAGGAGGVVSGSFWLEKGVRKSKKLNRALNARLKRFAKFNGVVYEDEDLMEKVKR